MSGTDYVLTPNYGLYKPIPNADIAQWGSHLNLNADTIDSTLHTLQTAGPFLPLAGGTVTGATTLNAGGNLTGTFAGAPTWSGAHTFSAGGTGLSVTNNATVGGTVNVTGAITSLGSSYIQAGNNSALYNFLRISPAAAGTSPNITLFGPDANRDLIVNALGTGALTSLRMKVGNNATLASTTTLTPAFQALLGSVSGIVTSPALLAPVFSFVIGNDTVDASAVSNSLTGLQISHNAGNNAGMKGGRYAITAQASLLAGTTGNKTAGINPFYGVANLWQTVGGNEGGTAPTLTGGWGQAITLNPQLILTSGAVNWLEASLAEWNINIQTSASVARKFGIKIVAGPTDAVQGSAADAAFKFGGSQNAVGWKNLLLFGGDISAWPAPGGRIMRGEVSNYSPLPSSAVGLSLEQIAFPAISTTNATGGFLRSNAFTVDGLGITQIGAAYLSPQSTGMAIDLKGIVGTGTPTVSAGGSGYVVGDFLFDAWGGIYKVATISGSAVATVTVYADANGNTRQPYYPGTTPPTNPVATTVWGSNYPASGCTLTMSWDSTRTTLSLNPTGKQVLTNLPAAATDAAAATAGVPIGGLYNNAGVVHVRLT